MTPITFKIILLNTLLLLALINEVSSSCNDNIISEATSKLVDMQKNLIEKERHVLMSLTQNIRKIMGEDIYGVSENMALQMDNVFTSELRKKIASLNDKQLQELESIILRSKKSVLSSLSIGGQVSNYSDVKTMLLEVNALYSNHPATRIIMWHELDHVVDGILKKNSKIKRMETSAFLAQYEFTRKVFSKEDLENIKNNFPTEILQPLKDRLLKVGLLEKDGAKMILRFEKLSEFHQNQDLQRDFFEYIKRFALNKFLVENVESALTMDKESFLRTRLEPYQNEVRADNIRDLLKYASGGAIAIYIAYQGLAGNDKE